ncbi:uncharacterized protein MONBRDRAFT_23442 [Monosiga brevicollis MX1]|uniref:Uncharacterized protein n=1 Tax=Monosiga brevicollis TaxID=81824 RepID=A9UTE8_MONBE|nr:uncharacterized protein MONBRDRAFT_23442 [Monosiga brevicollis MX1]EDQ91235.1 predicted protein [Monosiga brevicollis MX1]|eukprot:XP_001743657.1 hypothetical protein [Monosiga brevicollis MX1]
MGHKGLWLQGLRLVMAALLCSATLSEPPRAWIHCRYTSSAECTPVVSLLLGLQRMGHLELRGLVDDSTGGDTAHPVRRLLATHNIPVIVAASALTQIDADHDFLLEVDALAEDFEASLTESTIQVARYRREDDYNAFASQILYPATDAAVAADLGQTTFYEILHGSPAFYVPRLFAPQPPPQIGVEGASDARWFWQPSDPSRKRIAVFEPNDGVFRNSIFPILVIEAVFRVDPESFASAYICNTQKLAANEQYRAMVSLRSKAYRAGRMSFERTYDMDWFLTTHTDVVLSHNWDDAARWDTELAALQRRFPLVHNNPHFHVSDVNR